MTSALTDAGEAPMASQVEKYGWLKANAGGLAIAGALFFGAGAWGFVSSPIFATFFMGFTLFLVLFGMCLWIGAGSNGEWVGAIIAIGFFVTSLAVLFGAIEEARQQIKAGPAAEVVKPASS